jgi:hypothetical protein
MAKFDECFNKVKENRVEEGSDIVDLQYMNTKIEEMSRDDNRKRKQEETRNKCKDGWNAAYTDDWSGDEKEKRGDAILTQSDDNGGSSDVDNQEEEEENVRFR